MVLFRSGGAGGRLATVEALNGKITAFGETNEAGNCCNCIVAAGKLR